MESAELQDYTRGVVATLDERIHSLEAMAGQIDTIEAVNHGFLLLDRWEEETRQLLLERVGETEAGRLGKWEAGLVLGDIFGNFRRRTAANRIFLFSLREEVESRPADYYALYSSSL